MRSWFRPTDAIVKCSRHFLSPTFALLPYCEPYTRWWWNLIYFAHEDISCSLFVDIYAVHMIALYDRNNSLPLNGIPCVVCV
jgi:hypothetical protein